VPARRRCVPLATCLPRALAQESPDGGAAPPPPEPEARGSERLPVREYTDAEGRLCRLYERAVVIDGRQQSAFAVVCREANGRWVMSR
jgi:hypothetical protein